MAWPSSFTLTHCPVRFILAGTLVFQAIQANLGLYWVALSLLSSALMVLSSSTLRFAVFSTTAYLAAVALGLNPQIGSVVFLSPLAARCLVRGLELSFEVADASKQDRETQEGCG